MSNETPDQPSPESPPWSTTSKAIVAVVGLALIALVLWRFRDLIEPLIIAAILAYLLNPLISLAVARLHLRRGSAVLLVVALFLLVWIAALVGVGVVAFDQSRSLIDAAPSLLSRVSAWFEANLTTINVTVAGVTYTFDLSPQDIDLGELARQALTYVQPALSSGGSLAAQVASATFGAISTGFLILFVAIYLAKDGPLFARMIGDVAQTPGYRADAERLSREFMRIWDAYLRGQVILAVIMFTLVSLVLTLLGVNYSLGLGALSGLMEFLPVIGPLIATIAATLVAVFQDGNWLGLSPLWYGVLIIGVMFLLQQIESAVLVPRFVGEALDLHPVTVIVVVLMGASLAGILGAILAAPVTASIKLFGVYAWRKMFDLHPFAEAEEPPAQTKTRWWIKLVNRVARRSNAD